MSSNIFNSRIDIEAVKNMYNTMPEIWPESDKWYRYTYDKIVSYVNKNIKKIHINTNSKVVNIGSAGNDYGVLGEHYHVDIAEEKIKNCRRYFVGNAEELPFVKDFFDFGLCLGSVINYCDPMSVICEISRVLKHGASLFLDFEQSRSFQFIGSKDYNANASLVKSFNSGNEDFIWVFSLKHISALCRIHNLTIKNINYFHIVSPFVYKICKNEMIAGKFAKLDDIFFNKIPYINKISCNVILTVQKTSK